MPRVIPPKPGRDDAFFWEGAADRRLLARACASCGRVQHPPGPMCPACGSTKWTTRELSGRGTVHSWVASKHPSEPDAAPRVVVLVQLEEGIRLVSNLQGVGVDDVRNDMAVQVRFDELDGVVLPQFEPASPVVASPEVAP
jgi:uncharacterized OB-fold protein